jgi:hypothetical protein
VDAERELVSDMAEKDDLIEGYDMIDAMTRKAEPPSSLEQDLQKCEEIRLATERRAQAKARKEREKGERPKPARDEPSADAKRAADAAMWQEVDRRIAAAIESARAEWRANLVEISQATIVLGDKLDWAIGRTAKKVEERVEAVLQARETEITALRSTLAELRRLIEADPRFVDSSTTSLRRVN